MFCDRYQPPIQSNFVPLCLLGTVMGDEIQAEADDVQNDLCIATDSLKVQEPKENGNDSTKLDKVKSEWKLQITYI